MDCNLYRVELQHKFNIRRYKKEIRPPSSQPCPTKKGGCVPTIQYYWRTHSSGCCAIPTVTLYDLLKSGNIKDPLGILRDLNSALAHLHRRPDRPDCWHGYLSSENIEIKDGRAIINDYGYYLTHDYYYPPNPTHCAPEVLDLSQSPDRSVDSYAIGIIMIELYSARPAFYLEDPNEIAIKVIKGDLPDIPSSMPKGLAALCQRCISRNTTERPSIEEIQAVLALISI